MSICRDTGRRVGRTWINRQLRFFSLSAESEQNGGSDGCSEGVGVDVGCWAMYCGKGEVQITAVVEKQRPF